MQLKEVPFVAARVTKRAPEAVRCVLGEEPRRHRPNWVRYARRLVEDDDFDTDNGNDLVKQLRKANKQKEKELAELKSQFESISKSNRERAIICICYKWEGEKKVHFLRWDKNQCDKTLLKEFIKVANDAHELVGHNSDMFDLPWIRTRCLFHNIDMFPNYTTIDTYKISKNKFKFNSNKLDYIAKFLGVGACDVRVGVTLRHGVGDEPPAQVPAVISSRCHLVSYATIVALYHSSNGFIVFQLSTAGTEFQRKA